MTGASGNVGSALLERLRAKGAAAVGAYRDPAKAPAGQRAVRVDLGEPGTLVPAMRGVDTVFLLGAMSPAQTAHELAVLAAARRVGARVVKLSVWRADEGLSPIARLHRPVEEALRVSGLRWTVLRPNFYLQNFLRQGGIRASGEFSFPVINAPISFVDVNDIADVAAAVLTTDGHDGRVYSLTGPAALTYPQAAATFADVLGKPVRYLGFPDDEARSRLVGQGMPEFHADALIDVARAFRDGGAAAVTSTVLDLTGHPARGLAEFVLANRAIFG
ncbi:NAD(P)H-binding protein [Actinokineospora inagensis]|uniref:NAD(P)H-binding protein n=1 Tax=Actinokineospora inagensis TaxID=103730 RepID=UPI001FE187DE|nr:NAD(P)H-binding protein [Actinokineospora inagensis]